MTDFTQPFSMAGKTVLVTDGTTRLGAHIARLISRAGARVAIGALHPAHLQPLATDLRWEGGEVLLVALDNSRRDSVEAAMETVRSCFGSVQVLINSGAECESAAQTQVLAHDTGLHTIQAERGGSIINIVLHIDSPPT